MSKVRIALLATGVICLLAIGAFVLLVQNLDDLVRHAIESAASNATGTAVHVDRVAISLRDGHGTISGLSVANPPGFSAQPLFTLDSIDIRLDPLTLTGAVVVIEEVRIGAGTFRYEVNATGENNLRVVQKHARRQTKAAATATPPGEQAQKEQRLRIKRLVINDGVATLDLGPFGSGQGTARVPGMTFTDLGGEEGTTAGELATTIVQALGKNLTNAVGGGALQQLGDALNDAFRSLKR